MSLNDAIVKEDIAVSLYSKLYPFVLSPEVAALSMSGSTLIVVANALMLKRIKLWGINRTVKPVKPGAPGKISKTSLKDDVVNPALQT